MNERDQGCTEYITTIIAGVLLICSAIYTLSPTIQAKLGVPILAAIGLTVTIIVCVLFVLVSKAVLLGNARAWRESPAKPTDTVSSLNRQAQTIEHPAELQPPMQEAKRRREDEILARDIEKGARFLGE